MDGSIVEYTTPTSSSYTCKTCAHPSAKQRSQPSEHISVAAGNVADQSSCIATSRQHGPSPLTKQRQLYLRHRY